MTDKTKEELKPIDPCPFCGGEARTKTTRKMNTNKDMRYYIECKECYSSSNPWYDLGAADTKNEAITAWNQRSPSPTELMGENRKLKAALGHANAALDGFGSSPAEAGLVEALEEMVDEFEMDYVLDGEIVDSPPTSLIEWYRIAKKALARHNPTTDTEGGEKV